MMICLNRETGEPVEKEKAFKELRNSDFIECEELFVPVINAMCKKGIFVEECKISDTFFRTKNNYSINKYVPKEIAEYILETEKTGITIEINNYRFEKLPKGWRVEGNILCHETEKTKDVYYKYLDIIYALTSLEAFIKNIEEPEEKEFVEDMQEMFDMFRYKEIEDEFLCKVPAEFKEDALMTAKCVRYIFRTNKERILKKIFKTKNPGTDERIEYSLKVFSSSVSGYMKELEDSIFESMIKIDSTFEFDDKLFETPNKNLN